MIRIWFRKRRFRKRWWESRLSYLNRRYTLLERGRRKEIKAAKSSTDRRNIEEDYQYEIMLAHFEVDDERTRILLKKCRTKYVPVPPRNSEDEYWFYVQDLDSWVLTAAGHRYLLDRLYEVRSRDTEHIARWAGIVGTFIAALTGLAGSLIGIISILLK